MLRQVNAPEAGTVPLLQHETNTVIHVPMSDVEIAVRSGLYSPMKSSNFYVQNETGEVGSVTGDNLHKVLQSGYTIEKPEDTRKWEIEGAIS